MIDQNIEQLSFRGNGNIAPCPYRNQCMTYQIGCNGISYWCKRYDDKMQNGRKENER